MRSDAQGLFWHTLHKVKAESKAKLKRTPPDPVWLSPDYLPGLEKAYEFPVELMTTQDLYHAAGRKHPLVFDCEVYGNYFLIGFRSYVTGKAWYAEMYEGDESLGILHKPFDDSQVRWIFDNCLVVGFHSKNYDMIVTAMALAGRSPLAIKLCSDRMIQEGEWGWQLLRSMKIKAVKADHIDLIEVAPLSASLKRYGARLHTPYLMDLPFHPNTRLSADQVAITRWYCVGKDLTSTALLFHNLEDQLALRSRLSNQHEIDLRSKSDAQIAEAIIAKQIHSWNAQKPQKPDIPEGTTYYYKPPAYLDFKSTELVDSLERIRVAPLVVNWNGRIEAPECLAKTKKKKNPLANVRIGVMDFTMGIGGMHSNESSVTHYSDDEYVLFDIDAISYYPMIILNQGLYPKHLGPNFLRVFKSIVDQRISAKKAKNKAVADSLKITINGTFGKLGSPHSIVSAPDLMLQVTITGQLSLLWLAEILWSAGIQVISGNTDGIVVKCPRRLIDTYKSIVKEWERGTNFEMESVEYASLHSRDVNSYIAVKTDRTIKSKGAFSNPWNDPKLASFQCHKNPTTTICLDAIEAFLTKGVPTHDTIRRSGDIRKFISVRDVKGGAVKDGVYLGKVARWYYSADAGGEIIYAKSGNKVARSEGARPCMDLPSSLPSDIDYGWYERECDSLLQDLGTDPALHLQTLRL